MIRSDKVELRALEPEDLEYIYKWENDRNLWYISETLVPFSRYTLKRYLEEYTDDIYATKQLRLMIVKQEDLTPIGFVDLFNFDPYHQRVDLGLLIYNTENRGQGYATAAVKLIEDYCSNILQLHQIHCHIPCSNISSSKIFENLSYHKAGILKDWLKRKNLWEDVIIFQKIL